MVIVIAVAVCVAVAAYYIWIFCGSWDKTFLCPDCGSENLLPLNDMLWQCLGCQRQHTVLQLQVEKKKKGTNSRV